MITDVGEGRLCMVSTLESQTEADIMYRKTTVQYSTVQYCTVLYNTVQYCTVLYRAVSGTSEECIIYDQHYINSPLLYLKLRMCHT